MPSDDLVKYRSWLKKRLQTLAPVFAKAAIGDFSGQVTISQPEDELTEFFVGVRIMLDTVREQVNQYKVTVKELQTANELIANEKVRAEAILNSLGEGVVTVDHTWRTTYVNEPAVSLFGDRIRVLGQDALHVMPLEDAHGRGLGPERHPLRLAITEKRRVAFGMTIGQPYFVKSIGTRLRRLGMTITPIERGGVITGAAAVIRDITDESLVDRAKSEIISIASHQLRTPLTAIRWYAKTLITDAEKLTAEQRVSYLKQIYDSNNHLVQMVDTLLNVSRIELGTLNLKPQPMNLEDAVRAALKELNVAIAGKNLTVATHVDKGLLPVVIDPNSLDIIVQNLLSNAVKYSKHGGHVMIRLNQKAGNGVMEVRDEGVGIPLRDQPKLFSKLFRASNAAETATDGSGLGLYITKALLEQARGSVTFQSVEGQGTTFYAIIPSKTTS